MLRKTHLLPKLLICVICNILRKVLVWFFFPFSKLVTSLLCLGFACQHCASSILDGLYLSNSQPLGSPVLMAEQCQPENQFSILLWGRNTEFSLNWTTFWKIWVSHSIDLAFLDLCLTQVRSDPWNHCIQKLVQPQNGKLGLKWGKSIQARSFCFQTFPTVFSQI